MLKYFFLLVLIFIGTIVSAQKLKVVDRMGNPIENVIAIGDNFNTHTNPEGFLIYFPENGTSQLSFLHPNFKRVVYKWEQLAKADFVVTLEERNQQLPEVVINPSKRAQAISEIPQRVIAVTPDDAKIIQPQTTADLVGATGEVFIQKSQMGGGSPMLRGFSANRIMLVVDGVRMNNATYRSGNLQNIISIDAASLDQTEVIFGPGSVVYGSDALGGVIHFSTLKPLLSTKGIKAPVHVTSRFSSANMEKTLHTDFHLAGKKWASVTSATFTDYDDLVMGNRMHPDYIRPEYVVTTNGVDEKVINPNTNKQAYTAYSQLNLMQKLRFRPNDNADFEYAFHFSKTSDIPRYDRLIEYSGEKLKYAEWYYGPQQWIMHTLRGSFTGEGHFYNNLSITTAYQDYTESRNDRKFGKPTRNSRTENVDILSLNADADLYFSNGQSLYYGVEGVYNKIHSKASEINVVDGISKDITTRYPDGANWWSVAAYSLYNHLISDITSLQAGARYNLTGMNGEFDQSLYGFPFSSFSNVEGALTFNFGLVFNLNQAQRFHVNSSTGFRSPNIDDAAKVFDSEPGSVIVPNPNLEPEYASTFETGWKFGSNEKINFEVNAYYTRLYNAMVRRNGTLNGNDSILYDGEMSKVLMLNNTSWANIAGASARFGYMLLSGFKLKGGLNWQTGTDSDGLPVRHVAPMFGDIHALYFTKKLTFDFYTIYNGEIKFENLASDERAKPAMYAKDANGNPYCPAWYTLNVKASYKVTNQILVNAGAENLLNVRYRPYSSGIVAPGLNIILSVEISL